MGLTVLFIILNISILHIAGLAGRATNTFGDEDLPWENSEVSNPRNRMVFTNSRDEDDRFTSRDDHYEELNLEAKRLIGEYQENQELIASIGIKPYDIIFPVQVRHHVKMGISTRDTSQKNSVRPYEAYGPVNRRPKSRNHFATTSLYIKILNHYFELLLELNTQLLAPNLIQKHFLPNGAEQTTKQEIEHCYYQGEVRGIPGAVGAFRTCSGLSGVIHLGNETFVVHPLYGGDLSQNHPHVIFAAHDRGGKHGCANGLEADYSGRGRARRQRGVRNTFETLLDDMVLPADVNRDLFQGFVEIDQDDYKDGEDLDEDDEDPDDSAEGEEAAHGKVRGKAKGRSRKRRRKLMRLKRNIQGMTKFIELALILDKSMVAKFSRRSGYTREDIVHDALQIANIADLYFRTLNTRVSVVYVETWKETNQATVDPSDISLTLRNFHEYTSRTLFGIGKDTTQLLSGEDFPGGQMGMAVPHTLCSVKAVGIAVEMNVYEPHLLGGIVAHMVGHNIGMLHDDGREECFCKDWHGCIMAQSIIGQNHVLPYKFSECSRKEYMDVLRLGEAMCLLNKPNEIPATGATCGNKVLETGEECDCGTVDECQVDPCCDPITCKFAEGAECARGPCCTSECRLRGTEHMCRESGGECDLPEYCTGEFSICPTNVFKKNGTPCGDGLHDGSFCFNGTCPVRDTQCIKIWGPESSSGDVECYEHFNIKGSENGHCGRSKDGHLKPCDRGHVRCGSLHCSGGEKKPVNDEEHSNIVTTIKGREYHCKTLHDEHGLVKDGTPCGENYICLNQTCTSIYPHIDKDNCPSNHANQECSGNGVCTNANRCYCHIGWSGPDCSIPMDVPPSTEETLTTTARNDLSSKMSKKETPYENDHSTNTVFLVIMLMSVVGGVFILFALVALCYRRGPRPREEYGHPQHQPVTRYRSREAMNHHSTPEQAAVDMVDKMHTHDNQCVLPAGQMGMLSHGDSRSALTRSSNHLPPGAQAAGRKQQEMHQMQSLKNRMAQAVSDDEQTHSVPEKGILKKTYGTVVPMDGGEDSTSDNQEVLSQSDNLLSSDVEHKIRSLDGYTRNMLEALHTARNMQHHSSSGGNNTPSGTGSSMLTEEIIRRSLENAVYPSYPSKRSASQEKICDEGLGMMPQSMVEGGMYPHSYQYGYGSHSGTHSGTHSHDEDDDEPPPRPPIVIRNLQERVGYSGEFRFPASGPQSELTNPSPCHSNGLHWHRQDLIRQIEPVPSRHMSPSGSEDLQERMYLDGSESSRRGSRGRDDMSFVLGRFRPSANRHGSGGSAGSSHYGHPYPGMAGLSGMHHPDEESIYETADPDRAGAQICGDTPDSESSSSDGSAVA